MIELQDVSRIYHVGGQIVKAVDGVSLKIEQGDFVAEIVGENIVGQ